MISQARMNIFGNIIRTVHSGISAGVIDPERVDRGVGLAGADAGARRTRQCWISFGEHALDVQMRVDIGRAARSRSRAPS
jgi:hypothetical protein